MELLKNQGEGKHHKELIQTLYELNGQNMPSFYHQSLLQKNMMMKPNKEVFLSVEKIAEAIASNKKIRCRYMKYNHEHKLVDRENAPSRDICVYELIWTANYYYALCRFEDSGKVYFLRVDKMAGVEILDDKLPVLPAGFDRTRYVSTQPHLFGGTTQRISFDIDSKLLDQVVDSFGKAAKLRNQGETHHVELDSSIEMMHAWILQFSPFITNIYPEKLKEKVVESLKKALHRIQ